MGIGLFLRFLMVGTKTRIRIWHRCVSFVKGETAIFERSIRRRSQKLRKLTHVKAVQESTRGLSLEEVDAAWSFQRAWWPGLLPLLRSSYELLPRGQARGRARVIDLLHLFTQAEPIKLLIQEQEPISLLPWSGARMSNPVHQCAGHGFDVSVAVSYLLTQNMKD